jgi:hypothetical protein
MSALVELADVVRENCKKTEDGFCKYNDGWNDQRVRDTVAGKGYEVTLFNVEGCRRRLLGELQKTINLDPTFSRLESLRSRVKELERLREADAQKFASMQDKIVKLGLWASDRTKSPLDITNF